MRARSALVAGAVGLGVLATPGLAAASPLAPGSGNHPELQNTVRYCGPGRHVAPDGWTCLPDRSVRKLTRVTPPRLPIGQDPDAQRAAGFGKIILFGAVLVFLL